MIKNKKIVHGLKYDESLVPDFDKVNTYERNGHVIIGHEDMIMQCISCNEWKNQKHFSPKFLDRFGRRKLRNTCTPCELADFQVRRELQKAHGPAKSCVICDMLGIKNSEASIFLDHNHKTLKFRGWLCSGHNNAIGKFKDDPLAMIMGIKYLMTDEYYNKREVALKLRGLASELENA